MPAPRPDRSIPDPATSPTITLDKVAALLGISRSQAFACAARGEIPGARRVGSRWIVTTSVFLAHFELSVPVKMTAELSDHLARALESRLQNTGVLLIPNEAFDAPAPDA